MLLGDRVTLRGVARDDLERLWRLDNDLRVELAGGGDPPISQTLDRLRAGFDREAADGRDGADFAIELDGSVVSCRGLFAIDATQGAATLGIGTGAPGHRGEGYGWEAVRLLLDDAFWPRNLRRVSLRGHTDNERAIDADRACGFRQAGPLREHVWSNVRYVDAVHSGVVRDEWQRG